ncbi:hypothetical protein BH18ACT2_BH18ACT2_14610 [soil metagenome]
MLHAMATTQASASGAWAHHRADVRTRIVAAYFDLIDASGPANVSMPAVAERAGVSVRTLYRYFPTKGDLRRAATTLFDDLAREGIDGATLDTSNMGEYRRGLWTAMDAQRPAVRLQHETADGRAMRAERLDGQRAIVDAALPTDIASERRAEVVDLILALSSSSMFLELVDRMGHDPAGAADLITNVIRLIIEREGS